MVSAPLSDVPSTGDGVFGTRLPTPCWVRLLTLAQAAPHNWFGQQFAQIVRKGFQARCSLPVDVTIGSVRMRCALKDNHSERKFVFMPWRFDAPERALLAEVTGKDGVFVDIGANVGIYTLSVASSMGPGGRVVSFEPHPYTASRLRFNLAATADGMPEWPRVDVVERAVSDREGDAVLSLDPSNLGGSSLRERSGGGKVPIQCVRLTEALATLGITRVDALKIDVEGMEDAALMPFLRDAPDSLLPKCLVLEDSRSVWSPDFVPLIERRGFRLSRKTKMNLIFRRR